jgi:hypothetical protein
MAKLIIIITEQPAFVKELSTVLHKAQFLLMRSSQPEAVIEMSRSIIPDMILIDGAYGKQRIKKLVQSVQANVHAQNTPIVALDCASCEDILSEWPMMGLDGILSQAELLEKPLQAINSFFFNTIILPTTVNCDACGLQGLQGYQFCPVCGGPIGGAKLKQKTRFIETKVIERIRTRTGTSSFYKDMTLALHLREYGERLHLEVGKSLILGRVSHHGENYIDFTRFDAYAKGVSRRHAAIVRHSVSLILQDLGSFNGTYINGVRIPPRHGIILKDKDLINLGSLEFQVNFAESQKKKSAAR